MHVRDDEIVVRSARRQRETYVGPWLPEPLVTEHAPDPSEPVELAESLSMAFMVMLERLSPPERAVLLLHDVFEFEYAEIGRIVDKSEADCRQLFARAKKHLGANQARFVVGVIQRFVPAERSMRAAQINGQPGLIVYASGRPLAAMIFHIRDERIRTIYAVGNPDKLQAVAERE
jgi:RNA polymerase sigma-70 factor, ECF subfamily